MAGLVRKIHLYSGLSVLVLLAQYAFSGLLIVHHDWVSAGEPRKSTQVENLDSRAPRSPERMSVYLQDNFGLRGKRQPPAQQQDGAWKYEFYRPGTTSSALVSPRLDQVTITRTKQPLGQVLTGFHGITGYGGGWLYDLWVFLFDAASAGCIVFAVTGMLIWLLTIRDKAGWIFLGAGWGLSLATVLYLLFRP